MASLFDLAVMTVSGTPGTGSTINLGGAATINGVTFLTFAQAGATNGVSVDYSILDSVNGGCEIGTATYSSTGPSLTSRTPTVSSNSNAAINASSSSLVRISPRAETLQSATLFTSGTLADARLSTNVPLKNAANTLTAAMTISGALGNALTVAGSGGTGGDIVAHRGNTTGVIFFGNGGGNYLYFDGTNYNLPSGGLAVNGITPSAAGGVGAVNTAHAWVKFTGSGTNGAQTINDSYGVSSVSRTSAGVYTINFSTAFSSASYAISAIQNANATVNGYVQVTSVATQLAGSCSVTFINQSGPSVFDPTSGAYLAFIGN